MSKLTVREQEALTQTIIDRIQNVEIQHAEADYKSVKTQFDDIKNKFTHLHNEKEDIKRKLKILNEEHDKLRDEFNKDRRFAKLSQITSHHWRADVLDEWAIRKEGCGEARANISRDVIIATLKSKEDVQQLITDLVYQYLPRTKLKVAS